MLAGLASLALVGCGGGGGGGESEQDAGKALDKVNAEVAEVFGDADTQAVALTKVPSAREKDATRCHAALLKAYDAAPKRYTAFGAAHADGDLFCISIPNARPVNVVDRPYFRRAIKSRSLGIGDYQIGRVTGTESVVVAHPLLDAKRRPHGIVFASLDLDWLGNRLERRSKDLDAEVVVVDSKGIVIARTPQGAGEVGKPAGDRALAAAARNPAGKGSRTASYAYSPVPGTHGWIWAAVRLPAGK
jgi:hypothetical protein